MAKTRLSPAGDWKGPFALAVLFSLMGCQAPEAPSGGAAIWPAGEIVDLTHPFDERTVYWPTAEPFHLRMDFRGVTEAGFYYEANSFSAAEHGGTHLDAPSHFAKGRWRVDRIPLEKLMGPAALVDVSEKALAEGDYRISAADLEAWESLHGRLPDGVILLLATGYARRWPDPVQYLGTDRRGEAGVAELHFPGLSPEAARWLVERRQIAAVGIDTPSIDYGQSKLFESHRTLFEANIPAFENVKLDAELPATGFFVFALPMKIGDGSGAPLRIVALVPPPDRR